MIRVFEPRPDGRLTMLPAERYDLIQVLLNCRIICRVALIAWGRFAFTHPTTKRSVRPADPLNLAAVALLL